VLPDQLRPEGTIKVILSIIPRELMIGNIVELGDLGSFWLRINTERVETAEEVTPYQIHNVVPRFIPGIQFKWQLERIRFSKS